MHRLSYCAFLDVLGFSDRLRASYTNRTSNKLLQDFHAILSKRINQFNNDSKETLLYFKSFTDNVVLAHPRFSEDMESEFSFILWSILEYQFDMALQGFFVRGGLSVGRLFVDENSVYGEALLEAYHLESKVAVNPIVVLSDESMRLVDMHLTFYHGMDAPHQRSVLVGPDGRYFLNYLAECIVDTDQSEVLNVKALRAHKRQIVSALKSYVSQPVVFGKFSWLAAYHNHFCDSVSGYPGYASTLKVPIELSTTKFSNLVKK